MLGICSVILPTESGEYKLDLLNVLAQDPFGAMLAFGFDAPGHVSWRANTGELTHGMGIFRTNEDGNFDFWFLPEPTSLTFLLVAALPLLSRRRP